jgi:hypothetical protein
MEFPKALLRATVMEFPDSSNLYENVVDMRRAQKKDASYHTRTRHRQAPFRDMKKTRPQRIYKNIQLQTRLSQFRSLI